MYFALSWITSRSWSSVPDWIATSATTRPSLVPAPSRPTVEEGGLSSRSLKGQSGRRALGGRHPRGGDSARRTNRARETGHVLPFRASAPVADGCLARLRVGTPSPVRARAITRPERRASRSCRRRSSVREARAVKRGPTSSAAERRSNEVRIRPSKPEQRPCVRLVRTNPMAPGSPGVPRRDALQSGRPSFTGLSVNPLRDSNPGPPPYHSSRQGGTGGHEWSLKSSGTGESGG
jgi:hypothetical protein